MSLPADPRVALALRDPNVRRSLLSDLHLRIVAARDPDVLTTLLGRYVVAASASADLLRAQLTQQRMSKLMASISNNLRMAQDQASSLITNIKA